MVPSHIGTLIFNQSVGTGLASFPGRTGNEASTGQVENVEVRKLKYGNGTTETEVRKREEKPPLRV